LRCWRHCQWRQAVPPFLSYLGLKLRINCVIFALCGSLGTNLAFTVSRYFTYLIFSACWKFDKNRYSHILHCSLILWCCLVHLPWISLFVVNISLFLATNLNKERMKTEGRGRFLRFINYFLHETLFLIPIMIRKILFCNLKTLILYIKWPQKFVP
jgi:hypothetical protein